MHEKVNGVNFLKARGTYQERAQQHARILKNEIHDGPIFNLAKKNEYILKTSGGPLKNSLVQKFAINFYNQVLLKRMVKSLPKDVLEMLRGFADEADLPFDIVKHATFQADGLMILSRAAVMQRLFKDVPPRELPGCSSAIALGDITKDGKMLVARNQDYPIIGQWEKHPLVMFHEPSATNEIPHISISSAGVHTAGLTSMNAEGLTLATHAHFGKETSTSGSPIFTIGDEVISKAKNINEAIDIIRSRPRNANWSFVISSAQDKDAVVVEMSPRKTYIRNSKDGALTQTNFFNTEKLKKKEALISRGRHDDDWGRIARMNYLLDQNKGNITTQDMVNLLGDHTDPWSNEEKVFGNTISVTTTVKSVVFSPEDQKFWISTRNESPTGLGNFLEVDVNNFWTENRSTTTLPGKSPRNTQLKSDIRNYRQAYISWHLENHLPNYQEQTLQYLRNALSDNPTDGNIWAQAGLVAFKQHLFSESTTYFEHALTKVLTAHIRESCSLFLARCFDLLFRREEALLIYSNHDEITTKELKSEFKKGLQRPYRAKDIHKIILDLQFAAPMIF